MKKVGIVTLYYKTYNYGAQLQAYALQKAIAKLGYNAEVIIFRWYKMQTEQYYRHISAGNSDKFIAFSKNIPHSKRIYTPENIHECADDYDIFVCGSDQIWGVNISMPIYVLPQITLSFVPDSKVKITYAASMGGSVISDERKNVISTFAQRLDEVSVREKSAAPFVSEMVGKPVSAVLDPTMLLTFAEWDEIAVRPEIDGEFIFVYNIGDNTHLDETAKKLSNELNCELKTVSYSPSDSAGPAEFIGLIKHAKYVLTNSYHGTIFSIIYSKQFLTFAIDDIEGELSKNIRLFDLLELLELSDRFIGKNTDYSMGLNNHIDYQLVMKKLNDAKENSLDFLARALKTQKKQINCESDNVFADVPHPVRDYLTAVANNKTDKELSYEKSMIEKDLEIEYLKREYDTEVIRNNIYCKLLKFQSLGLSLDYDPLLTGKVIIYGAGKLGRLASECFDNNMICFVDGFSKDRQYYGYPIYRLGDEKIKALIDEHEKVTFLITPLLDFDTVEAKILELFENVNIVSVEKVVNKICL